MVRLEASTKMNRLKSKITASARLSGAKINTADRYWAKTIIGML